MPILLIIGNNTHFKGKWGKMKDRRITRTKKAIQNAYLDMLKKKGTEKITISDIAR